MADRWFRVELDLERIRQTLSREDGCEYKVEYVLSWLKDAGFRPLDAAFLVREADLGQVDPAEVLTIDEHPPPPPNG